MIYHYLFIELVEKVLGHLHIALGLKVVFLIIITKWEDVKIELCPLLQGG
jgi:hypothetical protein